jgi:Transposase DDE domain
MKEQNMGTVEHLAGCVEKDLLEMFPALHKSPREKLAVMVAAVVETRSCNTMELAARLPLGTERTESRYAWIERFLSADTLDDMAMMEVMTRRLLATLSVHNQTLVISLDQTSLDAGRAIAMMSARVGERALPLFWRVKSTKGNIAIKDYLPLLERLKKCVPTGINVLLLADRFFGSPELIRACQMHGFGYRIRLKGNLTLTHEGGELSVDDMPRLGLSSIQNADLCNSGVTTNIGYVHDKGHKEAWFIAMDVPPTRTTVLDYGLRWSIEPMFSDCKSRGFRFHDTQLQRTDRISRMMLVLALALTWAVANGQAVQKKLSRRAA